MLEKLPVLGRLLGGDPPHREGWRRLEKLRRKCGRRPVYRELVGNVVVCRADLARRILMDTSGRLRREPSVWQFGDGQQASAAAATELNRWLHGAAVACDVDRAAQTAVDHVARASGDLHRACLLASLASVAGMFGFDRHPGLAAAADTYIGDLFHARLVGSKLGDEQTARSKGLSSRVASMLDELGEPLPPVLRTDGALSGAERGEIYLHAVLSATGASGVMLAWLICALHLDQLAGIDMPAAHRALISSSRPEHVALEMLRLWPPASQHGRRVLEEHRVGPVTALRDDDVVIPVFALHRHHAEWRNALEFAPQRWEDDPKPSAFMPFSAGPGACIGAQFEIRWLAAVVRRSNALRSLRPVQIDGWPRANTMFSPPLCRLEPRSAGGQ